MKRAIILTAVAVKAAVLALAIGVVGETEKEKDVDMLACVPCAPVPECCS